MPYTDVVAAKTRRWETRVDEETDDLTSAAAEQLRVSKSKFVADAARAAAQDVLARSDVTLMDPELFDQLVTSLDVPDPAPGLVELAARPRRFRHG